MSSRVIDNGTLDAALTGTDITALEPALSENVGAAYLIRGEGLVNPMEFTTSLAQVLQARGVDIAAGTTVTGIRRHNGTATAVSTNQGDLPCAAVVIAAGAWSGQLTAAPDTPLPLQSGKGYSSSARLATPPRHPIYLGDKNVAISPMDGLTRIAGTMELSGNNRNLDWRRIAAIANASRSYLGQWYDSPDDLISLIKDPWVAGRPMLPDGLPALDVLPSTGNAFVSTGHGMLGVTLAPVSGRAIADFVHTGRRPAILQPFRSDRFRPRARSTERKTMRLTA